MDKNEGTLRGFCYVTGIVWFLQRIYLIEDARLRQSGEFCQTLLAIEELRFNGESGLIILTDISPGIHRLPHPRAHPARPDLFLQAYFHELFSPLPVELLR